MKRLLLIAVLFIGGLIAPKAAEAQIQVRVNIGVQPIWGPVGFEYVEYYYIPEIDVYYHVPSGEFIYYKNGRWINRRYLPAKYRNFDFFRTRVVVINERRPFLRHYEIKRRYANYRDYRPYITIRDVRDPRYFINRYHPQHKNWLKEQKRQKKYYYSDRDRDRDRRERDRIDRSRRDSDRREKDRVAKSRRDNDRREKDRVAKSRRDNDRRESDRRGNNSVYRR